MFCRHIPLPTLGTYPYMCFHRDSNSNSNIRNVVVYPISLQKQFSIPGETRTHIIHYAHTVSKTAPLREYFGSPSGIRTHTCIVSKTISSSVGILDHIIFEHLAGLEPTTYSLENCSSIQLNYKCITESALT